MPERQNTNIYYSITPLNPEAHLFEICCRIARPDPSGQIVYLPAWIPGSYMIRDFARNIIQLSASSNQQSLPTTKQDKHTWICTPTPSPVEITYTVYAWDLSVRTAHLDTRHGFFNGSSVFLAVKGQEDSQVHVSISLPKGDQYKDWRIATTLTRVDTELFSPGTYRADDYETLIDHPVEMGIFDEFSFSINNIPHHIIVTGKHRSDLRRLTIDAEKICRNHIIMFGELPDMERYMFLLTVVGNGYGGLEHRSSTALICSRKDLPGKKMTTPSNDYVNLLGLFSHEYFHTWNIKRIKPKEFIPYKLQEESYTELLWAFEGITSYYDELGLVRSGVINTQTYLTLLGKNITRVLRGSGRRKQTLLESSFEAWTKFYKQDENASNSIVSYYVKGALFALCLDLKIRAESKGVFSLDHIMQALWLSYGKKNIGITAQTIPELIESITKLSLADFFNAFLNTTDDLPLDSLLDIAGLKLGKRATDDLDDLGGSRKIETQQDNKTRTDQIKQTRNFNLGVKLQNHPLGAKVLVVHDGGAIQQTGISSGDIIIATNKLKTSKENFIDQISEYDAGDTLDLDVFRRDELMTFSVTLQNSVDNTFFIEETRDEQKKLFRSRWLALAIK